MRGMCQKSSLWQHSVISLFIWFSVILLNASDLEYQEYQVAAALTASEIENK